MCLFFLKCLFVRCKETRVNLVTKKRYVSATEVMSTHQKAGQTANVQQGGKIWLDS